MTKVFIIGGPGSGKTTLGRRLATETNADLFDLDAVAYEKGAGAERSIVVIDTDVQEILLREAWIAEGWYIGWTAPLAEAAEIIIWLDVPWRVAQWRIISRHAKASLGRRNPHPGLRKLWRFLQSSRQFYVPANPHEGRGQMGEWLSPHGTTVVRCRNNRETDAVVRQILASVALHPTANPLPSEDLQTHS